MMMMMIDEGDGGDGSARASAGQRSTGSPGTRTAPSQRPRAHAGPSGSAQGQVSKHIDAKVGPSRPRPSATALTRPELSESCKWLLPQPALGGPAGPCRGLQSTALTEVSPQSCRGRGPVRYPVLIRGTHESMSRCVWVRGAHRWRRGLQGQHQRTRPGKRRGLAPKSEPN